MFRLSKKFVDALVQQPETGMGFQVADVILKDGCVFKKVLIVNSDTVCSVDGSNTIPFSESEIDAIQVTHQKLVP